MSGITEFNEYYWGIYEILVVACFCSDDTH